MSAVCEAANNDNAVDGIVNVDPVRVMWQVDKLWPQHDYDVHCNDSHSTSSSIKIGERCTLVLKGNLTLQVSFIECVAVNDVGHSTKSWQLTSVPGN